jgi:hypothetical protein
MYIKGEREKDQLYCTRYCVISLLRDDCLTSRERAALRYFVSICVDIKRIE